MAAKLKPCTSPNGKHAWELVRNFERRDITINSRGTLVHIAFKGLYRCTTCPERKEGRQGWPDELKAAAERNAARKAAREAAEITS